MKRKNDWLYATAQEGHRAATEMPVGTIAHEVLNHFVPMRDFTVELNPYIKLLESLYGQVEAITNPDDLVALQVMLNTAMDTLPARDRRVLVLHFGLLGGTKPMKLRELGSHIAKIKYSGPKQPDCVSHERAKQLVNRALRKMRHPSRSREIGDMLRQIGAIPDWRPGCEAET